MTKEELLFAEMKPDVAAAVKELLEENERLKDDNARLRDRNSRLNGMAITLTVRKWFLHGCHYQNPTRKERRNE